jgi:hypothetical protein
MAKIPRDREHFARMTQTLLQCPAVTSLNHAAFRVLVILSVGARPPGLDSKKDPGRNGVQAITDTHARKFGLAGRDTVYRAIEQLIARGLIVRTRDGHRSKRHFALYGVGWLAITHREGQPLDVPEQAPFGYLNWQPPNRPKKPMPNRWRKLEMPSDSRTQSRPMNGQDERVCRPMDASKSEICRPMIGNTLRVSGAGPALPSRPLSPPYSGPLSKAAQSAKKLLATLPHLTDAEIARICRIEIEDAQTARKACSGYA